MNVLLISPLDPDVPTDLKFLMGGENTFTRTLLKQPPQGVQYTHFEEALKKGDIEYSVLQKSLSYLVKARILPMSPGAQCLTVNKHYDLIHCHAYSLKLDGDIQPPVVLSDSSSNILFLRDYLGWGEWRLNITYLLKKTLFELLRIYDQELNLKEAPLVVWSKFAKKVHTDLGKNPKRITVIPPGIAALSSKKSKVKSPRPRQAKRGGQKSKVNILFIGTWFERKGGKILLEVYKKLRKKYKDVQLTIVSQIPRSIELPTAVIHKNYLERDDLLAEVMPKADVLVLVPPKAEGYGLVVHEAASQGIPSIVTSVYALSELVKNGITGYVIKPASANALYKALENLIKDPSARNKMGKNAQEQFRQRFWTEKTNKKLLKVYRDALTLTNSGGDRHPST